MSLEKINATAIVSEHFKTLRDAARSPDLPPASKKSDVLVQVALPLAIGLASGIMNLRLSHDGVGLVITALSVFVGLLFNLLVLATSLRIVDARTIQRTPAQRLSREVLVNIEYAIALAFLAIVVLLPATIEETAWSAARGGADIYMRFATAAVVALVAMFILTLLMVLKRMHVVIDQHFRAVSAEEQREGGTATQRIFAEKADHQAALDAEEAARLRQ